MRDVDDSHDDSFVEDLVNHPVFATPSRVAPLQLTAKRLADTVGILRERTSEEPPTHDGHRFGQEIGQRHLRGVGQLDAISHRGSRPAARISFVTSSSVQT
jgi:hypothetical protein